MIKKCVKYFGQKQVHIDQIPMLNDFIRKQIPIQKTGNLKKFYIETYGCQMNESDTEIINSILLQNGYDITFQQQEADLIFLNTCAIRENAEQKIWQRLSELRKVKKQQNKNLIIGVLGCMAERLKSQIKEQNTLVDLIVGPDAYRNLPQLIKQLETEDFAMDVQLSLDETYEDIQTVRTNPNNVYSYVSIMRGCNNMCSFCIVPFTRGRERSRPMETIVKEVENLRDQGIKEITFLGQNVNSYFDNIEEGVQEQHQNSEGFKELYKLREGKGHRFANLLEEAAKVAPNVRFRFTSPHPKDFPDKVLDVIAKYPNICKQIHMPAQAGNTEILFKMRRNYSRESYIQLANNIRLRVKGVALSSDFMVGFCGETDEQFQDTLTLIQEVKYDQAFLFAYSMREKTHAHRNFEDDVDPEIKKQRLQYLVKEQRNLQEEIQKQEINRYHLVLVDGKGKKENQIKGRTDTNKSVVMEQRRVQKSNQILLQMVEKGRFDQDLMQTNLGEELQIGQYVIVYIKETNNQTLFGIPVMHSDIHQFASITNGFPYIESN